MAQILSSEIISIISQAAEHAIPQDGGAGVR